MDFMYDVLKTGRKFRTLNIIDDYNREALAIEAKFSFTSHMVTTLLNNLIKEKGKPERIRVDNGPEFIAAILGDWCFANGIKLLFIQRRKATQNGFIERFNRTFRQDVLDSYIFENISQVRILAEEWKDEYNQTRPHEALGGMTPIQFKIKNGQIHQGEASFSLVNDNLLIYEK